MYHIKYSNLIKTDGVNLRLQISILKTTLILRLPKRNTAHKKHPPRSEPSAPSSAAINFPITKQCLGRAFQLMNSARTSCCTRKIVAPVYSGISAEASPARDLIERRGEARKIAERAAVSAPDNRLGQVGKLHYCSCGTRGSRGATKSRRRAGGENCAAGLMGKNSRRGRAQCAASLRCWRPFWRVDCVDFNCTDLICFFFLWWSYGKGLIARMFLSVLM